MDIFKQKSKFIAFLFCFVLWVTLLVCPQFAFANEGQKESSSSESSDISTQQVDESLMSDTTSGMNKVSSSSDNALANSNSNNSEGGTEEKSASVTNDKTASAAKTDTDQSNSQNILGGGRLLKKQ